MSEHPIKNMEIYLPQKEARLNLIILYRFGMLYNGKEITNNSNAVDVSNKFWRQDGIQQ